MIQNSFSNIVKELKGLINDEIWSALSDKSAVPDEISGTDILLAVSGGMDSMCMAHLFLETFGGRSFAIAHCNFNLRAEESDGDERMVKEWAESYGIRFHTVSFDTLAYAERNALSIEMAARELRYRWFADLCCSYGYRSVAVAHHAEDNAETMLLNMVRGTGLKGMTGMKAIAPIPYTEEDSLLRLLRPMLQFSRKQIEGHVLRHRIPYRTDSTNSLVEYRRNRIRHEVFPALGKLNPSFVNTLNREMAYLSDASEIVDQWCCQNLPDVLISRTEDGLLCPSEERSDVRISIPRLLSKKSWRYLLYHILEPYGFNSATLASIESLLESDRTVSGKSFFSATHVLRTERTELVVNSVSASGCLCEPIIVDGAGLYLFGDISFSVEICPWSERMSLKQPDGVMIFDASKLKFPFICRPWRRGDWIRPLGMRGRKKLSDLFADLKWDAARKASAPVLVEDVADGAGGRRVVALLGVRMDDRFKVSDDTEMIIQIKIR